MSSRQVDIWIYDFKNSSSVETKCNCADRIRDHLVDEACKRAKIAGKPLQEKFKESGCIPVLVDLMRKFAGSESTNEAIVFMLAIRLLKSDAKLADVFMDAGVIDVLLLTYKKTTGNNDTTMITTLLGFMCIGSVRATDKIITSNGLKYIHDFCQIKPRDRGYDKMSEALNFLENTIKSSMEERRRVAQAGSTKYLVKASKIVMGQIERNVRVEQFLYKSFYCMGRVMEENMFCCAEADKEGLSDVLVKVVPDSAYYCTIASFKYCTMQLVFFMWDLERMKKRRKAKDFRAVGEEITKFHQRCEKLGYKGANEGMRCKPYIQRLAELVSKGL